MLLCSTSVPFGRGCSGASLHLDCWEPQQKCGCSDVCLDTEESQGRAEQRGKPIPPQCFGLIEVVWEPPGPNNTSAEEGQGLTKRASNQCETPLKLGFQSVRFALFCASSKNYLSIIDLSSLKNVPVLSQLCTAFLFHTHLLCNHSTGLPQRVLLEKEFILAFLPHLQLYHCLEPVPKQCKGRKC